MRLTARARLTLLLTTLVLAAGAALTALTYLLMQRNLRHRSFFTDLDPAGGPPLGAPQAQDLRDLADRMAADTLSALLTQAGLALIVVTGLAAVLGWLMAGRVLRPIRAISSTAQRLSAENLTERVPVTAPADELSVLAATVNEMLDRIQHGVVQRDRILDSQRLFTANAAHELRTPLTTARTAIDVTLDGSPSRAELLTMAGDVRAAVEHVQRVLDGLLLLARSRAGIGEREPADLAGIAATALNTARQRAHDLAVHTRYVRSSRNVYLATDDVRRRRVAIGGFSAKRLARVRELLERHVESGFVPGMVAVLARRGEVHVEATGNLAFEGAGSKIPMAGDTICRIASMTKPIVAACAMTLVEDCTLRLDDPVDDLLPELADMAVLVDPHGPLDDTVPAIRPITLRDLLTFTLGTGMVLAEPGTVPIADALDTVGEPPLDEWIRRLGTLPLVHQPGERWMYETAADVTGVLIARATGMSFGDALRERICDPLGMKDTAFSVGVESIGRFATAYERDNAATGEPVVEDGPDGQWSRPPLFEGGGGGLVSTADDYLAFTTALLTGDSRHGERLLSRPSVTLMTSDHLTPAQKAVSGFWPGYFDTTSWGFGMSVRTRRTHLGPSVGSYGTSGKYGTAWYNDPAEDMTTIFIMQRAHAGDQRLPMWNDFWTTVYQAIDD